MKIIARRILLAAVFPIALLFFYNCPNAHAEWEILPESFTQLYETYGLYIDHQNTLDYYGQAQIWAAVGGVLAVYGNPEAPSHPEFTIIGTGNFGLYYTENFRFYTQNIDARVGGGFQASIDDNNRYEIDIIHQSAHTADGVISSPVDIVDPGVGAEFFDFRFVHDFPNLARVGADYMPFIRSDPQMNQFANFDIFGEIFPLGVSPNFHHGNVFAASGFSVGGPQNNVIPTFHIQAGVFWGNHMQKTHWTSLRLVAGYYTGADPRLKYYSLLGSSQQFWYFGMMFDL